MLLKSTLLFGALATARPLTSLSLLSRGNKPALVRSAVGMSPICNDGEYPRSTNRLSDGRMIGACVQHEGDEDVLKTVLSTNGGKSWEPLGEVYRGPRATHDINNCFPFVLDKGPHKGRVLYAYRNHERKPYGDFLWFRLSISYSDDGGKTFKYLGTIDERAPKGVNGLWEPFIQYNRAGTEVQVFYSSENSAVDQDSIMRTSTDHGVTWSAPKTISGQDRTARDGMLGVAPLDDSQGLIAVFESTEDGRFVVDSVRSNDDGKTWGDRQRVFTPDDTNKKNSAGAPQVWNVFGTLVVSLMTNEDRVDDKGLPFYKSAATKVITSTDGGKTWRNKKTIFADQANWPGMALLGPGHLVVMAGINDKGAMSQTVQLK